MVENSLDAKVAKFAKVAKNSPWMRARSQVRALPRFKGKKSLNAEVAEDAEVRRGLQQQRQLLTATDFGEPPAGQNGTRGRVILLPYPLQSFA